MTNGVTIETIGSNAIGVRRTTLGETRLGADSAVSWSGDDIAEVFTFEADFDRTGRLRATQRVLRTTPAGGPGSRGRFEASKVLDKIEVSHDQLEHDSGDELADNGAFTLDLDGDGTGELVLIRALGTITVHQKGRELHRFHPPQPFRVTSSVVVELGVHQVLLLAVEWREPPPHGPIHALVRIDGQGVRLRVPGGLDPGARIDAVGALTLPGSSQLDELLLLWKRQGVTVLSRHRADAVMIGPPREVYVPLDGSSVAFRHVPASAQAVALHADAGEVFFISPQKEANWIRRVAVGEITRLSSGNHAHQVLGVSRQDDRLLVGVGYDRWAWVVDEESRFYARKGDRYVATGAGRPALEIAPRSPQHEIREVVPGGELGELLVIECRNRQDREVDEPELLDAAQRFLRPQVLAEAKLRDQRLDYTDWWKGQVRESLDKRGVREDAPTLADVKRLAPEVYADMQRIAHSGYLSFLRVELVSPVVPPSPSSEHGRWLASVRMAPQTLLVRLRAFAEAGRWTLEGFYRAERRGVAYRAGSRQVTVVTHLARLVDDGTSAPVEEQRHYVITAAAGAGR